MRRMTPRCDRLVASVPLLVLMLVVSGCGLLPDGDQGGADDRGQVAGDDSTEEPDKATEAPPDEATEAEPTEDATEELEVLEGGTEEPTEEPTDEPIEEPTEETEEAGELPEEWHVDSSGDGVPDFIAEQYLESDPEQVPCFADVDCPGIEAGELAGLVADEGEEPPQESVMLLLDSSGSMADELEDGQKMELAKEAVEYFAVATPDTTDLGFAVFGHAGSMDPAEQDESCAEIGVLAELGEADHESVPPLLEEFSPTGFTPLALALATAGEAFDGREEGDNRVVLISDGLETCDGDPVAEARALHESGIELVVDVIAYDVPEEEHEALEEIAEVTGGEFLDADTGDLLRQRMREISRLRGEATGSFRCLRNEAVDIYRCLRHHRSDLRDAFRAVAAEGDYTDAQEDAIDDMRFDARDWAREQHALVSEWRGGQHSAVQDAREEAEQRVEERYGEELSDEVSLLDGSGRLVCADPRPVAGLASLRR